MDSNLKFRIITVALSSTKFWKPRSTRQDLGGLVFQLQIASGGQRPRGIAQFHTHPVPQLLQTLHGKVFGDKGYLSKKFF